MKEQKEQREVTIPADFLKAAATVLFYVPRTSVPKPALDVFEKYVKDYNIRNAIDGQEVDLQAEVEMDIAKSVASHYNELRTGGYSFAESSDQALENVPCAVIRAMDGAISYADFGSLIIIFECEATIYRKLTTEEGGN